VICDYFNEESVARLGADRYDVIIAQNVFAHNTYPKEFLRVCKDRLSNNGRLFIQTSQADMVAYGQFDTIYHEHISFFNVRSMGTLAQQSGMYLENVFKTDIHGTSYVFVLTTDPKHNNTQSLIDNETKQTLDVVKKFTDTAIRVVTELKDELNRHSDSLIVGYGAAAKGNTLLNFGEIDLDYIVDDNPLKQGLYTPGRKIKIVSLDELIKIASNKPIVWVPLSWNFFNEIRERIKNKYHEPTVFIKYFPNMQVILDENKE
jgi:SAM-dependent methyltransferase